MMRTFDCDRVDREDVVSSYLSDRISTDEAEAFERHYFGCDRCWSEVQRAIEIRAALQPAVGEAPASPLKVPKPRPVVRRKPWPWIAAAATVVLAAALWRVNWPPAPEAPASDGVSSNVAAPVSPPLVATPAPASVPPPKQAPVPVPPDVLRNPTDSGFRVQATRMSDGGVRLQWPAQPKAVRYVIRVFAADGTPVLTHELTAVSALLTREDLGRHASQQLDVRVEAMSVLDVAIVSSARTTIAARRPPVN